MKRFEKIALKLVEGKSTYLDELRYMISVAEGKIPAHQDAMSIVLWMERAKDILFNKRALLTSQIGAWNYRKVSEAFYEWHRAWVKVSEAESKMNAYRDEAFEIGKKNSDLRGALEQQSEE